MSDCIPCTNGVGSGLTTALDGVGTAVYDYNTIAVPSLRRGTGVALISSADVMRNNTRSIVLGRGKW